MNEIPQNMALQCPSLTLYAFHLRNSINQGLQPTVSAAPRLWEQLVDLGKAHHIRELQILRQKLICYEGNRYFPEAEDFWGAEYLTLLENNEPSLHFQVPPQEGGLELQGLLCPFRLHDTYAIDLTLFSQDTLNITQLNSLNPQNLILHNIQASLGQTILLFGQPLEAQEDNYQVLADACVAQLFPAQYSSELVETGSLLGNPIFEYEPRQANQLHILVWFKGQDMNPNHMDRVAEILLHLLWCRHKILYVYQQSRSCVKQAQKISGNYDEYKSNFHQISETPNRRSHLINLHAKLQQLELDYTNYLDDLEEYEKTIAINYINYKTYLKKLKKFPYTKLSFCQEFLRHVGNKLQRQIQVDRDYLGMGRDRLQGLKATVWESITTEPVASEPWSGQGSGGPECKSALALQKELHYYGNNALKSKMPGIPPEIYPRLKQALSDCPQFRDSDRLIDFFDGNDELKPWSNELKKASSRGEQAERVIGYLVNQYRNNTKENVLLILLRLLKDQIPSIQPLHQTLSGLLQELTPILSGASSNSNVVPFPTQTNINLQSLPKAELALEANPKGEPIRFIVADEKLLNCARAVARVSVTQIVSGSMNKIPTGTGWLVTQNLALTCWHVIEARGSNSGLIHASDLQKQIANSTFTFDFTQPGEGIEYGIDRLEHKDVNLDYALLRLRDRPDCPLKKWGFLKLDTDVPLTLQTQLYVIQHPKGQPQQHSSGFFVKEALNTKILHNAPTEPGTSGAPVLNVTNFRVVALHNGENEAEKLREATTIKAILADLKQHRPELYDEILAVQNQNQE